MTDGTFVTALADKIAVPFVVADGRTLVPAGWSESRAKVHAPAPILMGTLSGLADYIAANVDGLPLESLMLHVVTPQEVRLIGALEGEPTEFRRKTLAVANAATASGFGSYQASESFGIWLRTNFVQTPDRDALVSLVASIAENDVRETVDDGVAQTVKTHRGVALVGNTPVPPTVTLEPFRTFREVQQPASEFVLRLQKGTERPNAALFEADGGAWKLEAISRVAAWLREHVKPVKVVA